MKELGSVLFEFLAEEGLQILQVRQATASACSAASSPESHRSWPSVIIIISLRNIFFHNLFSQVGESARIKVYPELRQNRNRLSPKQQRSSLRPGPSLGCKDAGHWEGKQKHPRLLQPLGRDSSIAHNTLITQSKTISSPGISVNLVFTPTPLTIYCLSYSTSLRPLALTSIPTHVAFYSA